MSVITDLIDENSSCHARIAKRDARIVELESAAESLRISRDYHHEQENEYRRRWAGVTTGAHSIVIPERDAVIRKAVGMCNRIPGSTTWNAAEYAYDELVAILYATPAAPAADAGLVEAFTTATNRLDRIALELTGHWANEATDAIAVSRAALAAHRAKGVV